MNKLTIYRTVFSISVVAYFIGSAFRIMHWPFSLLILVLSLSVLTVSSVLYFSSKYERTFIDDLAIVVVPLWSLFHLLRITYAPFQQVYGVVALIVGFAYLGYCMLKWFRQDANGRRRKFKFNSYVLGGSLIGLGFLFKYLRWPSASIIILLGMGLMFLSFFISMFSNKNQ